MKILTWDNGGFVVFYKRLEAITAQLDGTQLAMLLDGILAGAATSQAATTWEPTK